MGHVIRVFRGMWAVGTHFQAHPIMPSYSDLYCLSPSTAAWIGPGILRLEQPQDKDSVSVKGVS